MEKKPTNRGKMSNKRCIRARLQYLQHCYKASEATSRAACCTLAVFLADLPDSPFRCFVWITKFTFPQLMPIIAQVLKGKLLKITAFAHSQTTNKLVNKAANNSARVSRQDGKKLPALPTNQIAGFGGFRPLASLEKINDNNYCYENCKNINNADTVQYKTRRHWSVHLSIILSHMCGDFLCQAHVSAKCC